MPTGRHLDAGQADSYRPPPWLLCDETASSGPTTLGGSFRGAFGGVSYCREPQGGGGLDLGTGTEMENKLLVKVLKLDCLQAINWGPGASAFISLSPRALLCYLPTNLT